MMDEKLLSPEEVAERLSVKPNTVRSWLREGNLEGVKVGKRVWRIKESDLNNYLCKEQAAEYGMENTPGLSRRSNLAASESKLKELLLEELSFLSREDIRRLYDLAVHLRKQKNAGYENTSQEGYMKARQILKSYSGLLSNDLEAEREDRV